MKYLHTYTGKHINPLDLQPDDICIEDIAHALALCNRFAGHSKRPISVAQHSVFVSRLSGSDALQGLFHDASEAYIGDITKWIKASPPFDGYRVLEERIQTRIFQKFGCDTVISDRVKEADKLMLRFEGEQGYGFTKWSLWAAQLPVDYQELVNPEEVAAIGKWIPWNWKIAEGVFLRHFHTLMAR